MSGQKQPPKKPKRLQSRGKWRLYVNTHHFWVVVGGYCFVSMGGIPGGIRGGFWGDSNLKWGIPAFSVVPNPRKTGGFPNTGSRYYNINTIQLFDFTHQAAFRPSCPPHFLEFYCAFCLGFWCPCNWKMHSPLSESDGGGFHLPIPFKNVDGITPCKTVRKKPCHARRSLVAWLGLALAPASLPC